MLEPDGLAACAFRIHAQGLKLPVIYSFRRMRSGSGSGCIEVFPEKQFVLIKRMRVPAKTRYSLFIQRFQEAFSAEPEFFLAKTQNVNVKGMHRGV